MIIRAATATAMLMLSPISAHAVTTCDQFKRTIIAGAAEYKAPVPKFELDHVNSLDAENTFWTITTFGDVRSAMSCWHGEIDMFAVDADSSETMSTVHLLLLMAIGLHGYGLDWRPALELRDQLVRTAKASDPRTAEIPIEDAKASFVISFAGVPSFQIETDR